MRERKTQKSTGGKVPVQLHSWQDVTAESFPYVLKEMEECALILRHALAGDTKKSLLTVLEPALHPESGLSPLQTKYVVQKTMAVLHFFDEYSKLEARSCYEAARVIGKMHNLSHRTIARWALEFIKNRYFSVIILNPPAKFAMCYDEEFRHAAIEYVQTENKLKKGMTSTKFRKWVNSTYSISISGSTAQRWLKALGFDYNSLKKAIYFDGHERPDVIEKRKDYVNNMLRLRRTSMTYSYVRNSTTKELELQQDEPNLQDGELETVIYFQDETICYSFDGIRNTWSSRDGKDGVAAKKGSGQAIMISEFVNDAYGFLKDRNGYRIFRILEIGKGKEGYWNSEDFSGHIKQALAAHDHTHGKGKKVAVLIFDHSSGHGASSKDELNVERMTLKPGSNNKAYSVMRDTKFLNKTQSFVLKDGDELLLDSPTYTFKKKFDDDTEISQTYRNGDKIRLTDNLCGECKGAVMILKERRDMVDKHVFEVEGEKEILLDKLKYTTAGCKKKEQPDTCTCAKCVLSRNSDFEEQLNMVDEIIATYNKEHGTSHKAIILPKYHCELNPIERCWARLKWYLREHCSYDFEGLKEAIKEGLSEHNIPLELIRKYALKSWAYIEAYSNNLDILKAHDFVKKQKKHRGLIERIEREIIQAAHDIREEQRNEEASESGDDHTADLRPDAMIVTDGASVAAAPKPRYGSAAFWQKRREKEAKEDEESASESGEEEDDFVVEGSSTLPKNVKFFINKNFYFSASNGQEVLFQVQKITKQVILKKAVYWCLCNPISDAGVDVQEIGLHEVKKAYSKYRQGRSTR